MAAKLLRQEQETHVTEDIVKYDVTEFTCDKCDKTRELRYRASTYIEIRPSLWEYRIIHDKKVLFCDECIAARRILFDSDNYKRVADYAMEILDLYWWDDGEDNGYSTPNEYDDLVELLDKIRQMMDNYQKGA